VGDGRGRLAREVELGVAGAPFAGDGHVLHSIVDPVAAGEVVRGANGDHSDPEGARIEVVGARRGMHDEMAERGVIAEIHDVGACLVGASALLHPLLMVSSPAAQAGAVRNTVAHATVEEVSCSEGRL
jgi:hypothetical protein